MPRPSSSIRGQRPIWYRREPSEVTSHCRGQVWTKQECILTQPRNLTYVSYRKKMGGVWSQRASYTTYNIINVAAATFSPFVSMRCTRLRPHQPRTAAAPPKTSRRSSHPLPCNRECWTPRAKPNILLCTCTDTRTPGRQIAATPRHSVIIKTSCSAKPDVMSFDV